jgi:hypothetical protein
VFESVACVAFYNSKPRPLRYGPGPDMWPQDNLIYCIGSRCLGETNDVLNGMKVDTSCRPAMSLTCTARCQAVGSLGTVAVWLPRVVEPPCIVAIHYEWAMGPRCTVAVLQSPCSHILLAFNVLPATRLAGAWRRPCHVAL